MTTPPTCIVPSVHGDRHVAIQHGNGIHSDCDRDTCPWWDKCGWCGVGPRAHHVEVMGADFGSCPIRP